MNIDELTVKSQISYTKKKIDLNTAEVEFTPTSDQLGDNPVTFEYGGSSQTISKSVKVSNPSTVNIKFIDKEMDRTLYEETVPYGTLFEIDIYKHEKDDKFLLLDKNGMAIGFKIEDGALGEDGVHKEYFSRVLNSDTVVECEMLRFDYYYESYETFKSGASQMYTECNNDLSNKIIGFSDYPVNSKYKDWDGLRGRYTFTFPINVKIPMMVVCRTKVGGESSMFGASGTSDTPVTTSVNPKIVYYMKNLGKARNMFLGQTLITTIPENIFINNKDLYSVDGLFKNSGLTNVPEDLLKYAKNITNISNIFSGCSSITTIPERFFQRINKLTYIEYAFNKCVNLTAIPSGIFKTIERSENVGARGLFSYCEKLTEIPEDLFQSFDSVINMSDFAYNCKALTSVNFKKLILDKVIPDNPQNSQYALEDMFILCGSITGEAPNLQLTYNEDMCRESFLKCYKLTNFFALPNLLVYIEREDVEGCLEFSMNDIRVSAGESVTVDVTISSKNGIDYKFDNTGFAPEIYSSGVNIGTVEMVSPNGDGTATVSNFFKVKFTSNGTPGLYHIAVWFRGIGEVFGCDVTVSE